MPFIQFLIIKKTQVAVMMEEREETFHHSGNAALQLMEH